MVRTSYNASTAGEALLQSVKLRERLALQERTRALLHECVMRALRVVFLERSRGVPAVAPTLLNVQCHQHHVHPRALVWHERAPPGSAVRLQSREIVPGTWEFTISFLPPDAVLPE
jgi:hypothetical protein